MVEIPKRPHSEDLRFITHSPLPWHREQLYPYTPTTETLIALLQRNHTHPMCPCTLQSKSPLPLKPPGRPQNKHTLIHHPLAHAEVAVDPLLKVFVLGDLVGVEAGAVEDPRRGMKGLAFSFLFQALLF